MAYHDGPHCGLNCKTASYNTMCMHTISFVRQSQCSLIRNGLCICVLATTFLGSMWNSQCWWYKRNVAPCMYILRRDIFSWNSSNWRLYSPHTYHHYPLYGMYSTTCHCVFQQLLEFCARYSLRIGFQLKFRRKTLFRNYQIIATYFVRNRVKLANLFMKQRI